MISCKLHVEVDAGKPNKMVSIIDFPIINYGHYNDVTAFV